MSEWHRKNQKIWQPLRRKVLQKEPFCRHCKFNGLTVEATVVDHIIPVHRRGSHDISNLQPLCKPCHDKKTYSERKPRVTVNTDGWIKKIDHCEIYALDKTGTMVKIRNSVEGKTE